ncbi:MAG: response regulator transcription factor [Bryobacteraceae bacterium]
MPAASTVQDVAAPGAVSGGTSGGTLWLLVVEDERKMAELLRRALEEQGCVVQVALDGLEALRRAQQFPFDVITLDAMLPGLDGFQVARELRRAQVSSPILFLTARDSKVDVILGLEHGDDYLTKPFSFVELLARVRALARRRPYLSVNQLRVSDLVLDYAAKEVRRAGQPIELSRTEYLLLEFLMRNAERALMRQALFDAVWGAGHLVENNTLDVFIRLLRKKVDDGHPVKLIHTVRGFGYRLATRQVA